MFEIVNHFIAPAQCHDGSGMFPWKTGHEAGIHLGWYAGPSHGTIHTHHTLIHIKWQFKNTSLALQYFARWKETVDSAHCTVPLKYATNNIAHF